MNRITAVRRCLFVMGLGLGLAAAAHAQDASIKPGLWEHAFTMKSQSGKMEAAMNQMQQQMAALPPDQRKMMEQMMAAQGVGIGNKGQSVKVCITPAQAAAASFPVEEGCTQKVNRKGNSWDMSYQCKARDGAPASSGQGTVTLENAGAYTGDFTVNTTMEGKPEKMSMNTKGRWLGADCGNIKPAPSK